jgi:dolichol-phosphate mannosyltransferase
MSISIILPTYNEAENLKILIPEILNELNQLCINEFEILVVDDNSSDDTKYVVNSISKENKKVKLIIRKEKPSLPMSIYEGIKKAEMKNVMWLDADGSMDAKSVGNLILFQKNDISSAVIGSRFVEGGGYKGQSETNKNKNFVLKNLMNSEDSLLAVFLSIQFNKLLKFLLKSKVKDLTSGFIIAPKKYFNEGMFNSSTYGEYFINVVLELEANNVNVIEFGYFCKPRIHGVSKTSGSLINLIKLSRPYLGTAFRKRLI